MIALGNIVMTVKLSGLNLVKLLQTICISYSCDWACSGLPCGAFLRVKRWWATIGLSLIVLKSRTTTCSNTLGSNPFYIVRSRLKASHDTPILA